MNLPVFPKSLLFAAATMGALIPSLHAADLTGAIDGGTYDVYKQDGTPFVTNDLTLISSPTDSVVIFNAPGGGSLQLGGTTLISQLGFDGVTARNLGTYDATEAAVALMNGATLENSGVFNINGGSIAQRPSEKRTTFVNLSGGALVFTGTGVVQASEVTLTRFENRAGATVRQAGGAATITADIAQTGSVVVDAGTLTLLHNVETEAVWSGVSTVAAGAGLVIGAPQAYINGTASAGAYNFSGAVFDGAGLVSLDGTSGFPLRTTVDSGTTVTFNTAVNFGTVELGGAAGGVYLFNNAIGATSEGTHLTISGAAARFAGSATLRGTVVLRDGGVCENTATLTLEGAMLDGAAYDNGTPVSGGSLINRNGATLILSSDTNSGSDATVSVDHFVNEFGATVTQAGGDSVITGDIRQLGSVNVEVGTLAVTHTAATDGVWAGVTQLAAGTTLLLGNDSGVNAGRLDVSDAVFNGAGTVAFLPGGAAYPGAPVSTALTVGAGKVATFNTAVELADAALDGTAWPIDGTTAAPGGMYVFNGPTTLYSDVENPSAHLANAKFRFNADTALAGSVVVVGDARIENAGNMVLEGASIDGGNPMQPAGIFANQDGATLTLRSRDLTAMLGAVYSSTMDTYLFSNSAKGTIRQESGDSFIFATIDQKGTVIVEGGSLTVGNTGGNLGDWSGTSTIEAGGKLVLGLGLAAPIDMNGSVFNTEGTLELRNVYGQVTLAGSGSVVIGELKEIIPMGPGGSPLLFHSGPSLPPHAHGDSNRVGANVFLSDNPDFTGSMLIQGGAANISGVNPFGHDTTVVVDGGAIATYKDKYAIDNDVVIQGLGATVDTSNGDDLTLNGVLSGDAPLSVIGGACFIVTNAANTYSGPVRVVGSDLGVATFDVSGNTTFAGAFSGQGFMRVSESGTLVANGANAGFSGTLALDGGNFILGADGATGTGVVAVTDGKITTANGARVISSDLGVTRHGLVVDTTAGDLTLNGVLSGSGSINMTGGNKLILTNDANSYAGTVFVNSGTLSLMTQYALGSGTYFLNGGTVETNGFNITPGGLRGTGRFDTGTGGTITLTQSDTTTFSGDITGAGGLDFAGTGALRLSGRNTYTGTTSVSGSGTLTIDSTAMPDGPLSVGASGTLNIRGTADTLTVVHPISGSGRVSFSGPCSFTLDETVNLGATGTLDIRDVRYFSFGTLNDITAASVTVTRAGYLQGSGDINGNLTVTDTVFSPGNSPGVVTVYGDYTQSGGMLVIELGGANPGTGAGFHDQIVYTGTATIGNGAVLNLAKVTGFTPANGEVFRILWDTDDTTPAISGRFARIQGDYYSIVHYDNLGASVSVYNSLAAIPGLANKRSAPFLGALSALAPSPSATSPVAPITERLAVGDIAGAARLVSASAPTGLASLTAMPVTAASRNGDFLRGRENTARAADRSVVRWNAPVERWSAYLAASGSSFTAESGVDAPAFDHTLTGGKVGLDYGTETVFGAVAGYDMGKATMADSAGRADMDRASVMLYVSQVFDRTGFVQLGVGVGKSSYDVKRDTMSGRVNGDTDGTDFDVAATVGYKIAPGGAFDVTPYAGLTYTHAKVDGFTESGNAMALKVDDYSQSSLRAKVGGDFGWKVASMLRLGLDVAVERELMDNEVDIPAAFATGGASFTTTAPSTPETILSVGPNVSYGLSKSMSISAGYKYELGLDSGTAHRFDAAFTARF